MSTPRPYAKGTKTEGDKSQGDIRRVLTKHGAEAIAIAVTPAMITVAFAVNWGKPEHRSIRYSLPLPAWDDERFVPKGSNAYSSGSAEERQRARHQDEINRLWRVLVAIIVGRMAGLEGGVETLEQAFWKDVVEPTSGLTIYEHTCEPIKEAYRTGKAPQLLPGLPVKALPMPPASVK